MTLDKSKPLPATIMEIADALEAIGVRCAIVAIREGDPTPLIENRIEQRDAVAVALATAGHKLGAWLTQKPKTEQKPPAVRKPPTK